jgi:hypothetical protein
VVPIQATKGFVSSRYNAYHIFGEQVYGIGIDGANNYYTVETDNAYIWRLDGTVQDGSGQRLTTIYAGTGVQGHTGDGGLATLANLDHPGPVTVGPDGNLYVSEMNSGGCDIRMINATTGIITTIAGTYGTCGHTGDGGAASSALLFNPQAIEFFGGDMYLAETGNCDIRRIHPVGGSFSAGTISTVVGSTCYFGHGFVDSGAAATTARLAYAQGITWDASGNMYVVDQSNEVVYKIGASSNGGATWGTVTVFAGTGANYDTNMGRIGWGDNCNASYGANGGVGGAATSLVLCAPTDVKFDASGNLYIEDNNFQRIVKVPASGNTSNWAGTPTLDNCTDGPIATSGIGHSFDMRFDTAGNLVVISAVCGNMPNISGSIRVINMGSSTMSTVSIGGSPVAGFNGPHYGATILPPSTASAPALSFATCPLCGFYGTYSNAAWPVHYAGPLEFDNSIYFGAGFQANGPVTFQSTLTVNAEINLAGGGWINCPSPCGINISAPTNNSYPAPNEAVMTATTSITWPQPVKSDSAHPGQIVPTTISDTGPGIVLGVCTLSAGTCFVQQTGVTSLYMGAGSCTVNQFVEVDSGTNGRVACTSTYVAGVTFAVSLQTATANNLMPVMLGLR